MGVVDVGGEKSNGVMGADVNVVETFIKGEKVGNRLHRQEKLGTKLGGNNTMPRIQSSRKLTWKKRARGGENSSQNLQHVPTILGSRKGEVDADRSCSKGPETELSETALDRRMTCDRSQNSSPRINSFCGSNR
jgi:hypothetical protein